MKIKIMETVLRDGQQSLLATRLKIEDILPILEKMDQVGYHAVEVWGGATFDSCLRYLSEDPWARLRKIKLHVKNTPLQMLLRGQNILGYRHYPDDVLEKFIEKAIYNGIDIVRIFDALNDIRNMEKAIKFTKKYGGHAQGTIVYTVSPIHDLEHYIETAKELKSLKVDSLCLKDMAGLLTPYKAFELIDKLKKETALPIQIHSHDTSGMAAMTYLKSIEAGVDIIDTAISALSSGSSQPATETMIAVLSGTEFATELPIEEINEIAYYFRGVYDKYREYAGSFGIDPRVLSSQIPGGMLTNLHNQLQAQDMLELYDAVLEELPRVRKEMGYPPLVTPTSQIIGTQAVFNIATGDRYSLISKEITDYVKGMYGRPPGNIDPEIKEKVLDGGEAIDGRPADYLENMFEPTLEEIKNFVSSEEDVLSYILFPDVAEGFLKAE